jgi:hypothetical protein
MAALALGCGGSDGPTDLTVYFDAQPYANAACNVVDQQLAGQRQMRLYVNGNVALMPITQGLARYYRRHTLSFFTEAPPQATTMAYALDTDTPSLVGALTAAFPDADFSDQQALMADPVLWPQIVTFIANFVLKPMVDFAKTHSDVGQAMTNLIVVTDLERPGGDPITAPGQSLAGLAISPALLAEFGRTMPEEAQIWEGVQLPADFTPMLVLGDVVLKRAATVDPVLRDLIAAHEFGHTGALVHSDVLGNLMIPAVMAGYDDCTLRLDGGQLALMRTTLGVGAAAAGSALLARRPAAIGTPGPSRPLSSFTPDRLRALLAGDRQAMRSFVELLFHAK